MSADTLLHLCLHQEDETVRGVQVMATERGQWLDRPDLLVRAARHYEGAAQILIRHAVMTASQVSVTTHRYHVGVIGCQCTVMSLPPN